MLAYIQYMDPMGMEFWAGNGENLTQWGLQNLMLGVQPDWELRIDTQLL
jgi:hypothetical protein